MAIATLQHHLSGVDRELRIEGVGLGDIGNVSASIDRLGSEHRHHTALDGNQSEYRSQEGAFACPVRSDEGERISGVHVERHAVEHGAAVEPDGEIFDAQW
jgi:hypothetical protein